MQEDAYFLSTGHDARLARARRGVRSLNKVHDAGYITRFDSRTYGMRLFLSFSRNSLTCADLPTEGGLNSQWNYDWSPFKGCKTVSLQHASLHFLIEARDPPTPRYWLKAIKNSPSRFERKTFSTLCELSLIFHPVKRCLRGPLRAQPPIIERKFSARHRSFAEKKKKKASTIFLITWIHNWLDQGSPTPREKGSRHQPPAGIQTPGIDFPQHQGGAKIRVVCLVVVVVVCFPRRRSRPTLMATKAPRGGKKTSRMIVAVIGASEWLGELFITLIHARYSSFLSSTSSDKKLSRN